MNISIFKFYCSSHFLIFICEVFFSSFNKSEVFVFSLKYSYIFRFSAWPLNTFSHFEIFVFPLRHKLPVAFQNIFDLHVLLNESHSFLSDVWFKVSYHGIYRETCFILSISPVKLNVYQYSKFGSHNKKVKTF